MAIQMKAFCPYCKKEVEIKMQTAKEKVKCPDCKGNLYQKRDFLLRSDFQDG